MADDTNFSWDSPTTNAQSTLQQPQQMPPVAPQRQVRPGPISTNQAEDSAQGAGAVEGLIRAGMNTPQQQAQLHQMRIDLLQNATNHMMAGQSPLRKISHLLGGVLQNAGLGIAGASSGQGFQGVLNMMKNGQNQRDAEDQNTTKELLAAKQISMMDNDPDMLKNLLSLKKQQATETNNNAKLQQKQQQMADAKEHMMRRDAAYSTLAGTAQAKIPGYNLMAHSMAQNAQTRAQDVNSLEHYREGMMGVARGNLGVNQTNSQSLGKYRNQMGGVAQQNADTRYQEAGSQDQYRQSLMQHHGNQDINAAYVQRIKPWQMGLSAAKAHADLYDKLRYRGLLPEDMEEEAKQADQNYMDFANQANQALQASAPQQPVQQQGSQGAPQQPVQQQGSQGAPQQPVQQQGSQGASQQSVMRAKQRAQQLMSQGASQEQAIQTLRHEGLIK